MSRWFARWFSRSPAKPVDRPIGKAELEGILREALRPEREAMHDVHDAVEAIREVSSELVENVKKLARAHGRTALRVEEIERRVLAAAAGPSPRTDQRASPVAEPLAAASELLDALDLLDHVVTSTAFAASPSAIQGLERVRARLTEFLGANGYERIAPWGQVPDGTLFKVVGTEVDPRVPSQAVTHVVRAAVRRGDCVLREGEVITAREES